MNRLARESSPYLLQHASNPVDWYPWCDEAIAAAVEKDCPIFLSIGYSACHWCHVMEHESFENQAIADVMNSSFINIKVDREERPDLDQIYMSAVTALTGRGGWPMSVFLTPDLRPFFGGTYWPPETRLQLPGFRQILIRVRDAWDHQRDDLLHNAEQLTDAVRELSQPRGAATAVDQSLLRNAEHDLLRAFDARHGGFGTAPKFPHPMDLRLLLRLWRRFGNEAAFRAVELTCDRMARGGIRDHLGGGFHRYSTDAVWLAPHFEKMLYDNALLVPVYVELLQLTGDTQTERVIQETLDYVLREMTLPDGGFCSTQDADSEGEEGRFFVWTRAEIMELLGDDDGTLFCEVYDVTEHGNWEGKNILNRSPSPSAPDRGMIRSDDDEATLRQCRQKLFISRAKRVAPGTDDKVLTSWNGMMISALAQAGAVMGEPRYTDAAANAARFLLSNLVAGASGTRLMHTWRNGNATVPAFLDDYACIIDGLIALHQATLDDDWIESAAALADEMLATFGGDEAGCLYYSQAGTAGTPLTRVRDSQDNATPSGNSMAATALLKLAAISERPHFRKAAADILSGLSGQMQRIPMAAAQALMAVDHATGSELEITVSLSGRVEESALVSILRKRFLPGTMLRKGIAKSDDSAASESAVVCQHGTCQLPVDSAAELLNSIQLLLPLPTRPAGA